MARGSTHAYPESVSHSLTSVPEGLQIGPEIASARVGKIGIERELEVDVRMDIASATNFYQWLRKNLIAANVDVSIIDGAMDAELNRPTTEAK